jgi:large subunit ribosomal protein L13
MAQTETKTKTTKTPKTTRFLGWQDSPIQQASFGRTTKGGRQNQEFALKNSVGPVKGVRKTWYVLDASETPIGRLASVASSILMGKHRTTWTPGAGSGDGVIVINASKAYFTSNKADKKIYYWHTQWMGGLKSQTAKLALEKNPEDVIWQAVQGMLPKNRLSRYQLAVLKIFKGAHNQAAQKPVTISLKARKALLKNIKTVEAA